MASRVFFCLQQAARMRFDPGKLHCYQQLFDKDKAMRTYKNAQLSEKVN